jgi:hypothetical protein
MQVADAGRLFLPPSGDVVNAFHATARKEEKLSVISIRPAELE